MDRTILLLLTGLGAVGNYPGLGPEDPACLKLLLLHTVDHMLLPVTVTVARVVWADDVYLGGRLAALVHIYDVVCVGDVKDWVGGVPVKVWKSGSP